LKVILIGPAYPLRGGIANFNESLATAFKNNSIDAEIISFYFQYPSFLFPGKTQKSDERFPETLAIKSLISSINPISWYKTARYIKKDNPDLIVIQFWLPLMAPALGSILRMIGKKKKAKVIAVVHNAKPHEKRPGDNFFTKYLFNKCDGFISLSSTVLNDISNFTSSTNKIFVPHPVYDIFGKIITKSEARKFLDLKEDEKIILFFGIIRKYKGLELLLKSMATDKLKNLKLKLLVAGEFYEDQEKYFELIKNLGLKDNVQIVNKFIENDNVKYYFCASDIVVQPYLHATQSGVTQIAYNFERPMLVTRVGGLAEIVFDKYTGYVTGVNEDEISSALMDFYDNDREKEFSANVAKEKYRFSWQAMIDAILSLKEKANFKNQKKINFLRQILYLLKPDRNIRKR